MCSSTLIRSQDPKSLPVYLQIYKTHRSSQVLEELKLSLVHIY